MGAGSGPDGTGNACQCGDLDLDGFVAAPDLGVYRSHLADPIGMPLGAPALALCDVAGPGSACDALDVAVTLRAITGLGPGILPRCAAALPL